MKMLKVCVIGGGSSYTPELVEGIIKNAQELPVGELWLVDIEEGRYKLETIHRLAKRMVEKAQLPIKIVATLDRREAIKEADFVITQFRVGGLEAREKDELIPLKYNVIGQETTGPGGFAKALRTIPVIMEICQEIETLAPKAWLINFTNPAGMITEAILNYTQVKAIGLCNVPISMKKDIARVLDVDAERVDCTFMGLNHMSFIKSIHLDGEDVLEKLIQCYQEPSLREKVEAISDVVWNPDFLRAIQMIPSPYHRYYYMTPHMLEEEKKSIGLSGSRARQVKEIEKSLFELYEDEELNEKPKELEKRGGAYYSEAAISLINAIYNNKMTIHTVNVQNKGVMPNVPYDGVIEVNAVIGKQGAMPLNLGDAPISIVGLINSIKAYEQMTVKAAISQKYEDALVALIAHPLIPDIETAKNLLKDLLTAHSPYLDYIKKSEGINESIRY